MSRWQEYDWDLMVRRKAPAPLIAAALLLAWWVATAESGSLTVAKCKADHNELLASIEDARHQAIQQINAQIAGTDDQLRTASLKALRERAWDQEESQRGQAQQIYFDCMNAVPKAG